MTQVWARELGRSEKGVSQLLHFPFCVLFVLAISCIISSFTFLFCRYGVRCNAILPGFVETSMTAGIPDNIKETVSEICSCPCCLTMV